MNGDTLDVADPSPDAAATVPAGDPAAMPDWAAAKEPVRCPLCDYDLRGLSDPRCPECGYRFTWPEVLDPARRAHPYLFEHHPHRGAWAFFRTLLGGLRPKRFWTGLLPSQPSRPRRIVLYWLLAAAPLMLAFVASNVHRGWLYAAHMRQQRAMLQVMISRNPQFKDHIDANFGSVEFYFASQVPLPNQRQFHWNLFRWQYFGRPRPSDKILLGLLAWPWLTLLSLMVFRVSMRRARIRPVHVTRCVLYNADVLFWVALLAVPVVGLQVNRGSQSAVRWFQSTMWPSLFLLPAPQDGTELALNVGFVLGVLCLGYRLVAAYRHYLRFDRPAATVLASQSIVFLVLWIVFVNWGRL